MNTFDLIDMYNSLSRAKANVEKELSERLTVDELYKAGLRVSAILKVRKLNPQWSLVQCKNFVEDTFSK